MGIVDALKIYLKEISDLLKQGGVREETYYSYIKTLVESCSPKKIDATVLPAKTEAGNPDIRVWDGKQHITGYIEAKTPNTDLDKAEHTEQVKRYRETFPNFILTNFFEFRLYRNNEEVKRAAIGRPFIAEKLKNQVPLENVQPFTDLIEQFLDFSLPRKFSPESLAVELAKRTKFLRDSVVQEELKEQEGKKGDLQGFFEAFKKYLLPDLTEKTFADLYSQTITYGLFAARSRSTGEFNRALAYQYIPQTIGILRDVFKFISLGNLPKHMEVTIDDIADVLSVVDINKILHQFIKEGKGKDPIVHFYETFLSKYDPALRETRGVYYTPEPVVSYIVRSIHKILKSRFGLVDGLASKDVTLLDPAAGTLTFPAEAIRLAVEEYSHKYGEGGKKIFIKEQILQNFYAFELMMAPYAIGHMKISFLLEELGYTLNEDERFKLYLTNTLEMKEIQGMSLPGLSTLSEESHEAGKIKRDEPILVILGNPPYSGMSANNNDWTTKLLKTDFDGAQSYYSVDGKPLGERNPKWLQDDYVKFLRFAQWKIQKAGKGIVGMITNHSYLDNPTFRGMRQSLMKTFNEIYLINLHGNSLKKEIAPDGGKDENVFDIRQGVAIALFIKLPNENKCRIKYGDLYGFREDKYEWLKINDVENTLSKIIHPITPRYLFKPFDTSNTEKYDDWIKINNLFPLNGVGMTTARDSFVIDMDKQVLLDRIRAFINSDFDDEELHQFFAIEKKKGWNIRKAWQDLQQNDNQSIMDNIKPLLYRPFDTRYIYYHNAIVWRTADRVMFHMIQGENIGLISPKQQKESPGAFITNHIMGHKTVSAYDINYLFPLYIYPDPNMIDLFSIQGNIRKANISELFYSKLESQYNDVATPEEILYYVYGILYSNIYRRKYNAYLRIDFPRIPFTTNNLLFKKISGFGKQLAEIHLMLSNELERPCAKYQGVGIIDTIEKVVYDEQANRVYINKEKYFEGITPGIWVYQIGGYQVLNKWLKDRKGRKMDDPRTFCRIATAIKKTIEIQVEIDKFYPDVEKDVIEFRK